MRKHHYTDACPVQFLTPVSNSRLRYSNPLWENNLNRILSFSCSLFFLFLYTYHMLKQNKMSSSSKVRGLKPPSPPPPALPSLHLWATCMFWLKPSLPSPPAPNIKVSHLAGCRHEEYSFYREERYTMKSLFLERKCIIV